MGIGESSSAHSARDDPSPDESARDVSDVKAAGEVGGEELKV
jgi:hypothetical protein